MAPVDSQVLTPAGPQHAPPSGVSISLSQLIDYIIQRTYHELTVLAELLPRKTDMERKIEIVQFAHRTRQLFVRLLALVKWANSASKVDKCGNISLFLDTQALYFRETADLLARMSRETLVQARLPSFSLPCAIDVLTLGTFPRLPACIKEKIIPPDPITPQEKRETLLRLNQIIEHRLVTIDLPLHMRRLTIENGRVKFHVEHEFEVTLTLMGDKPDIPWRLLDIEILVEDPETGDGKALVHSAQVHYIHQLVQSRLCENDRPLHDLYNCLHTFCQSLQLEVLSSQAQRLMHHRLGDYIRIEDYQAGRCLVLSYWRDPTRREAKYYPPTIYKLSIHVDNQDGSKPLQITHFPHIQGSESTKVAQAIKSDHLSIEKLLIQTIQVRSIAKLKELQREFKCCVSGPCEIRDLPSVLYVPVVYPCTDCEMLCISIDIQKGSFLVSMAEEKMSLLVEIEESLNSDRRELRKLLSRLRIWLGLQRCDKSIQHIQVSTYEKLPLVNFSGHALEALPKSILYMKLPKQSDYYLVVEPVETKKRNLAYKFYLLQVSQVPFENNFKEALDDITKAYLKAEHLVELDVQACTHGPSAQLCDLVEEDPNPISRKRKMLLNESGPEKKKSKASAYFVPELTHILALCEDRIPFIALGDELERRTMAHTGIQVDAEGAGLSLGLIDYPPCVGVHLNTVESLRNDLLSCKFRIHRKGTRLWMVEAMFTNCPIRSTNAKEQGPIHRVYFAHDLGMNESISKIVDSLMEDWNALAHLYHAVLKFAANYNNCIHLKSGIEIKTYTYKRLTLAYGPNKCYSVTIQYCSSDQKFHLSFGTCGQSTMANCHMTVATYLQHDLNETKSITRLAKSLLDTWSPLCSICKLNTGPMLGLATRTTQPTPSFTIIPQSATHIRVSFRNVYCMDILCHAGKLVSIRDGAYSMFDTSKVVGGGFSPTPSLKTFLNMFIDDAVSSNHTRRRSTTEDDNPPSPIGMDMDAFISQQQQHTGSPAAGNKQKQDSMRFPNPMTPPSNPHTPASPGGARMSQPGYSPSPSTNFLASPPSAGMMGTPSPGNILGGGSPSNSALHVPSPGSFVPAPSPSSLGMHMTSPAQFISPQGMIDGGGSPFPTSNLAMPSPGSRNWPGSPSMPTSRHGAVHSPQGGGGTSMLSPPSRILPQRSWAASVPTLLSHDALEKLLTPCSPPGGSASTAYIPCCPLEMFLSCVYLKRHVQRMVHTDDNGLTQMQSTEPGVILFKSETLHFRVALNPTNLRSITLRASPNPDSATQWEPEELQVLEKFFEVKIACPPYKSSTLTAFGNMLGASVRILKDCVQIMKLEMMPERNLKWSVQWCWTIPHMVSHIAPTGTPAVVCKAQKNLFVLQLTRLGVPPQPGGEPQTVVVPILYDTTTNNTSMPETRGQNPSQTTAAITNMLKRFNEFHATLPECSICPAVRELLTNLVIPI